MDTAPDAPPPVPPPATLSVHEAAAQLGVEPRQVYRWCAAGHLVIFVPPGHRIGDGRRGPKGCRIEVKHWRAFLDKHSMVGPDGGSLAADPAPSPARSRPVKARVTGTDGISRLRPSTNPKPPPPPAAPPPPPPPAPRARTRRGGG